MDHLKAIEGLLAFHQGEIERLQTARRVILEIERRMADQRGAAKRGAAGTKKLTVKKANGHGMLATATVKEKIIDLLGTEPGLTSATIMEKLNMTETKQHKGRVYTTLTGLKKEGRVRVDDARQYSLAVAA